MEMNKSLTDIREDGFTQREMMTKLYQLECNFRDTLSKSKAGNAMYLKFIHYIKFEKQSFLHSRIYLRERQNAFKPKIRPIFDNDDINGMKKLKINYLFCKWVMNNLNGAPHKQLQKIYDQIVVLRKTICEQSLPSAIHRAKTFWSMTPITHLEYMDLIQLTSMGLIEAIDKFEMPFKENFGNVVYGRMTLNLQDAQNETKIKIPAQDKRILHRAKRSDPLKNKEQMLDFVKESFPNATLEKIEEVINAETVLNINAEDPDTQIKIMLATKDHANPESSLVESNLADTLKKALSALSLTEKKVIMLKYGSIDFLRFK
jgi:RNA polymerase sigma factor (sigma-70 family)